TTPPTIQLLLQFSTTDPAWIARPSDRRFGSADPPDSTTEVASVGTAWACRTLRSARRVASRCSPGRNVGAYSSPTWMWTRSRKEKLLRFHCRPASVSPTRYQRLAQKLEPWSYGESATALKTGASPRWSDGLGQHSAGSSGISFGAGSLSRS